MFGGNHGKSPIEKKAASPEAGGKAPSGDDASVLAGFHGVGGECLVGVEMNVALDGETERAAQLTQFAHAEEAYFRCAHAKVAQSKCGSSWKRVGESWSFFAQI
jgi:hypothetical protein